MIRGTCVTLVTLAMTTCVGAALADDVASATIFHNVRTKWSQGRLFSNEVRKPKEGGAGHEQRGKTRSVRVSPLCSPTNGACDSPVCIPAELC